jgi:hypothetical protein
MRRTPPLDAPVRNSILAALLASEYKRLLPRLEHVTLTRGQVIYRADQSAARASWVSISSSGGVVTPDKAIVQLPGGAMRMKAKDLRKELHFGSPLQRLLLLAKNAMGAEAFQPKPRMK